MFYFFPLILALTVSAALVPLIRRFALRHEIVDVPTPRKIHRRPTPLLGGAAIYCSCLITTIILWSAGYVHDPKITVLELAAIFIGGLLLMIGGYLDDRHNLSPQQQIIFPVMAALLVVFGGVRIHYITNPLGGILEFSAFIGLLAAFVWILGMMYTTKFLDGLDGLVSGITVIGSIIIWAVSLYWDTPQSGTSILAMITAGACLGFLAYNWHPAKIFLGEGGSVFCGFMLAVLSIISGSKIATALLIMGVPILDVLWVIIRRLWQWQSPTQADRRHLHFRLLDIGLSHRQTVMVLYAITIAFGSASLFLHSFGKVIALAVLAGFMIVLATSLFIYYQWQKK